MGNRNQDDFSEKEGFEPELAACFYRGIGLVTRKVNRIEGQGEIAGFSISLLK